MLGMLLALMLQGAPEPPPSVITEPEWVKRPSAEEFASLYPKPASRENVEGLAVMECTVDAAGQMTLCRILDESPLGFGFGEAALKMAKSFRMRPLTKGGNSSAGGVIRIPIRFRLPRVEGDDFSVTMKCYGRTAAAADAAPSEEVWNAARVWMAQALVISHRSKDRFDRLEQNLSEFHAAALKETDPGARPTLKECLAAVQKAGPAVSK